MLRVEKLEFSYNKNVPVLCGADLELPQGQVGILLGKNGCGKTTLFKNILGIEKPIIKIRGNSSGETIVNTSRMLLNMAQNKSVFDKEKNTIG